MICSHCRGKGPGRLVRIPLLGNRWLCESCIEALSRLGMVDEVKG